jgi:hypothetical protein
MYDDQGYDPVYDRLDAMDDEPSEPDWSQQQPVPAPASWPRHDRRVRHALWQRADRASRPIAVSSEQLARAARRASRRPHVPSPF